MLAAPESHYQQQWCNDHGGIIEYVLPDRARVDCLTETHAVEFDFAKKWAEAIGQSLYYSRITGKRPGIVLIIAGEKDEKYIKRIQAVGCGIDIWTVPVLKEATP